MLLAKTWQPHKAVTCRSLLGILLQIFGNWIYLKYSKDNVQNTSGEYSQITRRMNVVVVLSCKAYPFCSDGPSLDNTSFCPQNR